MRCGLDRGHTLERAAAVSRAKVLAWLVDLDGTLYRPTPVKIAMGVQLALASAHTRKCVLTFRREHERLREELDEPVESPYAEQISRAASRLGLETGELERLLTEWMIRRPSRWIRSCRRDALLEEIRRFREAGGKTALVSDYPAREKLRALGAQALFDVVVANGEAGGPSRLKPNPDGYLLAAAEIEVAPQECLVLGDRDDADGEAARRARMAFRLVR